MKELYIGIDPSINSTGLVFRLVEVCEEDILKMYQITPKKIKCSTSVRNILYNKIDTNTKKYSDDDLNKIKNGYRLGKSIFDKIFKLTKIYKPDKIYIRMEGSLMSTGFKNSISRVNDLVAYNTMVKYVILSQISKIGDDIYFDVIAPTKLKKLFTGNGKSKKCDMVNKFKDNFDHSQGKNDDIADAFALSYIKI